jgi:hypothetical protein
MSCIRRVKEGGRCQDKIGRLNVEAVQVLPPTALHKVGQDHVSCLRLHLEVTPVSLQVIHASDW